MLGLKQQLVSSWGSDGIDEEKLHTKVIIFNINDIAIAITNDIAINIIIFIFPKTLNDIEDDEQKTASTSISCFD